MESTTDLEGFRRSLERLRAALDSARESGDVRRAVAAVRVWADGQPAGTAARAWLTIADDWLEDDEMRRDAYQSACDIAWHDPAFFASLERAFEATGNEEGLECIHRTRAQRSETGAAPVREQDSSSDEARPVDKRARLRVLDEQFRRDLADGAPTTGLNCAELVTLAFEVSRDLDTALGYVSEAWNAPGVDREALFDTAESLADRVTPSAHIAAQLHDLARQVERWPSVVRWQRALIEHARSPESRAAAWCAIADTYANRLHNPLAAIEAYQTAAREDAGVASLAATRVAEVASSDPGTHAASFGRALAWAAPFAREPSSTASRFERAASLLDGAGHLDEAVSAALGALEAAPSAESRERYQRLLRASGRNEDLLRELDAQVGQGQTPDEVLRERLPLLERAGRVAEALFDAFALLKRAPDDLEARDALQRLSNSEEGGPAALEAAARLRRTDASGAASLLWTVATSMGLDTAGGIELGMRALESGDAPSNVWEQAGEAFTRGEPALASRYHRAVIEHADDEAERTASRLALAESSIQDDPEEARVLLDTILSREPSSSRAWALLARLAEATSDPALLADALEGRLRHSELEGVEIRDGLSRLVAVYGGDLTRPDLAFDAAKRLLAVEPESAQAREAVRAYAEELGDLRLLYDTIASLGEGSAEARGGARAIELGQIAVSMGNAALAGEHFLSVSRDGDAPESDRTRAAREAFEALIETDDLETAGDAAVLLLEHPGGTPVSLLAEEMIDRLAERSASSALRVAKVAATLPEPTGPVLDRLAQLAVSAGEPETAIGALHRWSRIAEEEIPLDRRLQLARLLSEAGTPESDVIAIVAEALSRAVDAPELVSFVDEHALGAALASRVLDIAVEEPDDEPRGALLRLAIRWSADGADEDVRATHERALRARFDATPSDVETVAALRAILSERGDVDGETAVLQRAIANLDEEEALPLLRDLAALAGDDEDIERRQLAILEADFSDVDARVALADLYVRTERHEQAAELLEEAAEFADERDARAILRRAARLHREALGSGDGELRCLRRIIERSSNDTDALGRIVEIHEEASRWNDATAMLDALAAASNSDRATSALSRAARIREERLGDGEAAVHTLERALSIEPSNVPILEELARLHEEACAWDAVIATFDRIATVAPIAELQRELLIRAAPVLAFELERAPDAVNLLARAFDTALPSDEELGLLRDVAESADAWVEYAGIVRHVSERVEDDSRRVALEIDAAEALAEQAGQAPLAVEWLAARVVENPATGPRLVAVEQLAAAHGLERELIEPYKALAAVADSPEVLWHALGQSARIAEVVVRHPEVAFGILRRAAETPENRDAATAEMERLANEYALWSHFRDYLAEDVAPESRQALLRQAQIEDQKLGDWQAAFETLLGAYSSDPFDEDVRAPLYALAAEHGAWDYVAKLLERVQEDASPSARPELIAEIAEIHAAHMGRPAEAFAQQLRAWQLRPGDDALRAALEERARAADMQVDLLAAYEWHARQPSRPEEANAALERAADLAITLGLPQRAVALFTRMATANAGATSAEVIERAAERFQAAGMSDAVLELTLAVGRAPGASSQRVAALLRGAEFAQTSGNAVRRLECLREAAGLSRERLPIIRLIVETLREVGPAEDLAAALTELRTESQDEEERSSVSRELVELHRGPLDNEGAAVRFAGEFVEAHPDDEDARALFVDVLSGYSRWADLVDFHLRNAERLGSGDSGRAARLEAARIVEEQLDDPRRAARIADGVLEAAPDDREALELRARTLAAEGRWTEHLAALERLAAVAEAGAASAAYGQAALVHEDQLARPDRALEMWERAEAADSSNVKAIAEQARLHGVMDNVDAAIDCWRRAIPHFREESPAALSDSLVALAALERKSGAIDEAVSLLREAIDANPRSASAREDLEEALLASGDIQGALELVDEAIANAPDDRARAALLCDRAAISFYDGSAADDALRSLARSLALVDSKRVRALIGDINLALGRWDDASTAYDHALGPEESLQGQATDFRPMMPGEGETDDVDVVYLSRAGYAHEAGGRIARAQDCYSAANLGAERFGPALVGLARLALRRGQPEGARIYIDTYRACGPHDGELDEQMANVEIAVARASSR